MGFCFTNAYRESERQIIYICTHRIFRCVVVLDIVQCAAVLYRTVRDMYRRDMYLIGCLAGYIVRKAGYICTTLPVSKLELIVCLFEAPQPNSQRCNSKLNLLMQSLIVTNKLLHHKKIHQNCSADILQENCLCTRRTNHTPILHYIKQCLSPTSFHCKPASRP
jgi:hypothetical protein